MLCNTQVVNIWTYHREEGVERVYVGRACRGYPQSPLANPWRAPEKEREQTLARYRVWLREALQDKDSPQAQEILRLAKKVAAGERLALLCWCKPKNCHGDIVQEAVDRLALTIGG